MFCEFESDDSESLGDVEETDIVGDCAHHGYNACVEFGLVLRGDVVILGKMTDNARNGNGVTIESRLVQPLVDDGIKGSVGSARQERVELHRLEGTLMSVFR